MPVITLAVLAVFTGFFTIYATLMARSALPGAAAPWILVASIDGGLFAMALAGIAVQL